MCIKHIELFLVFRQCVVTCSATAQETGQGQAWILKKP